MTEDRPNGLVVLKTHKGIPTDIDEVINRFSRQKQISGLKLKLDQKTNELLNYSYSIVLKYII